MVKLKNLVSEATKVLLKPKEIGEGVNTEVYIDKDGYLVLINKPGQMVFLHSTQISQLKKFLAKVK